MPLSPPAARETLHRRRIDMHGYARADGLYDIEAWLEDTKAYDIDNQDRAGIAAAEALHGMWLRLTVSEDMTVQACEAAMDFTPYTICPGATPNFAALAGVVIGPGFNRAVKERVGGSQGCTHLRELLAQMATVAYQTVAPMRWRKAREARETAIARGESPPTARRAIPLNTCHAYAEGSEVVRRLRQEAEE